MTALLADDATAAILITLITGAVICGTATLIDHRNTRRHTMSTKARKPRSENNLRTKFEARGLTYPEGGAA